MNDFEKRKDQTRAYQRLVDFHCENLQEAAAGLAPCASHRVPLTKSNGACKEPWLYKTTPMRKQVLLNKLKEIKMS